MTYEEWVHLRYFAFIKLNSNWTGTTRSVYTRHVTWRSAICFTSIQHRYYRNQYSCDVLYTSDEDQQFQSSGCHSITGVCCDCITSTLPISHNLQLVHLDHVTDSPFTRGDIMERQQLFLIIIIMIIEEVKTGEQTVSHAPLIAATPLNKVHYLR